MRASPERRRVAERIAILERHHEPDAPQLAPLCRRLDELRVREIAAWASLALASLPDPAEVANVHREAARIERDMTPGPAGGEAA